MSEQNQKLRVLMFESLLKPSMDVAGQEIKKYFQNSIETGKSKKKEDNLIKHIEDIRNKSKDMSSSDVTYEQLDLFDEWMNGVEKVDPENKELSQIWHNLLLDSKNSFNAEVILAKLKNISSGDAITMMALSQKVVLTKEDLYRLQKLKKLELVERSELKMGFIQFLFLIISFGSVIATVYLYLSPIEVLIQYPRVVSIFVSFLPLIIGVSTSILIIKQVRSSRSRLFNIWQLTWLGEKLVKLSHK